LYRAKNYILTPQLPYETTGFVPNVCFPCATLCDAPSGRLVVYYGCADTYTGIAFTTVADLVNFTKERNDLQVGDATLGRD